MSDDELRRAALDVTHAENARMTDPGWHNISSSLWRQCVRLAKARLAEHPAGDDSQPVTEEWLRSVGFTDHILDDLISPRIPDRVSLIWVKPEGRTYRNTPGEWEMAVLGITFGIESVPLSTRGQVRRLLAALGVKSTP